MIKSNTTQLTKRLSKANKGSLRAIDLFTSAERKLQQNNDKITEVVTEINDKIIELEMLKTGALERREENNSIISRIRKIVTGD